MLLDLMDFIVNPFTIPIIAILFSYFMTGFIYKLYRKNNKEETTEIKEEINSTIEKNKNSETIFDIMIKNVAELREYYIISKQQANKSFYAALFISILGFCVIAAGIIISCFYNHDIIISTTITGSIVEAVSGLLFFIYKKTLKQLNIYHKRLSSTEKYLIAMQLIEKMSNEKKDENYRFLLEVVLIDNSSIVRNEKNNIDE